MEETAIMQHVRHFIISELLFGEELELAAEESLLEAGIVDSTGLLEVVAFLEETFELEVNDADLMRSNLDSLQRIAAFVRKKKQLAA